MDKPPPHMDFNRSLAYYWCIKHSRVEELRDKTQGCQRVGPWFSKREAELYGGKIT